MKNLFNICLIIISMLLLVSCVDSSGNRENNTSDYFHYSQNHESIRGGQETSFSLDKGISWYTSNNRSTGFDIWSVKTNEEVPGMVFFYATSYEQLLEEVENNRTTPFYSYMYLDNDGWNKLLDTYNEEYFEDNILLFYYKYEPYISENYVHSVIIKDNSLTLNINRFDGMCAALSSWHEFVTIKKTDIENITEFNVVVRTVSELKSSIVLSANEAYIRNIYVNGLSESDFLGLNNLKSVNVWTWGLMIDIHFNQKMSDERLNGIIEVLKSSESIRSVGYTSNTWIRVIVNDKFYDKYKDKSLMLEDLIGNEIKNSDEFMIEFKTIAPIILITLEMEEHGRNHYEAMIDQLRELNYPFINIEDLN